ncbi:MAG TPA: GNAT family N-acetyltransferase [Candidatus Nanopelagicaceae bacterium]|nr:GNAT family N-acetyltransferase [Candidatus Nanopelagicaceae bacterium]
MTLPARRLESHENLGTEILEILNRDPVVNCFLYSRLEPLFRKPFIPNQSVKALIGGEVWLAEEGGSVSALCYVGANLVPTPANPAAIESFARRATRVGRSCSSLVGPRETVLSLWDQISDSWGPTRTVRENQPLLVIDHAPLARPDERVRRVQPVELAQFLPASIAMFAEELGVSPIGPDGGALYRAKLASQVLEGLAFAIFENNEVIFKCEIGALSPSACQIQGVWTKPELRGRGIGTAGLARVVEFALEIAPAVCLYVNDFNTAARRSYDKIGFRGVGAFASVLF